MKATSGRVVRNAGRKNVVVTRERNVSMQAKMSTPITFTPNHLRHPSLQSYEEENGSFDEEFDISELTGNAKGAVEAVGVEQIPANQSMPVPVENRTGDAKSKANVKGKTEQVKVDVPKTTTATEPSFDADLVNFDDGTETHNLKELEKTTEAAKHEPNTVTIRYWSGWPQAFVHFDAGEGWSECPGVQMQSITDDCYEAKIKLAGTCVSFVFNDGNDDWDHPSDGENYVVEASADSAYTVFDGVVKEGLCEKA